MWARVALDLDLALGGGHDNALFRLAAVLPPSATTEDSFFEARPQLGLELDPTFDQRLQLSYAGVFRDFRTLSNGYAHGHALGMAYGSDLTSAFSIEASAAGSTEIPTSVDASYRTGTASLGPAWRPRTDLLFGLDLQGQWLDSPAIRGWFEGLTVRSVWSPSNIDLGLKGRGFTDGAGWRQFAAYVSAAIRLDRVRTEAEGGLGSVNDGLWTVFGASVAVEVSKAWVVALRYNGRYESYRSSTTPIVGHDIGMAVHYSWESAPAGFAVILDAARASPSAQDTPPGVDVRVATPAGVSSVALIGDFNGWDAAATRLDEVAPQSWEVHLNLPPGRYAYQVVIDGERCTPAGASAYAADDFGGENAVLSVTNESSRETLRCPR